MGMATQTNNIAKLLTLAQFNTFYFLFFFF